MSVFRPLVIAFAFSAVIPGPARAQAGMLVGFSLESGESDYIQGYSFAGTLALRSTARLGMRFDLGVQTFNRQVINYTAPCPPPSVSTAPCGGGPARGNGVTVVSTTASLVLTEHLDRANSFYWLAGLGVYALTDTPSDGSYARLGWNGGGGFHLGRNVVFEVRYHGLIDPRTSRGFVPITLGFRF
jgi:hypothetical protein